MKKQIYLWLIAFVALLSATQQATAGNIITKTEVYDFSEYQDEPCWQPSGGDANWYSSEYALELTVYSGGTVSLLSEVTFPETVKKVIVDMGAKAFATTSDPPELSIDNQSKSISFVNLYIESYPPSWNGEYPDVTYDDYTFSNVSTDSDGKLRIDFTNSSNTAYFYIRSITVEYETEAPPEPYAVLSEGNTVLTFYYDNEKDTKEWMSIGPFDNGSDRGWYYQREDITKVVFDDSFANCTSLTSTFSWFDQCKNLATIEGINNLKTDNVENMRSMFEACSSLTILDLGNLNTAKVTDFNFMFAGCSSLSSLNISSFDTESAVNMRFMFPSCSSLESLDLRSFNTANVTDMHGLFRDCYNLQTIYVSSSWTTASVTDSEDMFKDCSSLVGDAGTTYNASHTDAGYAHIDEGQTNPGYLSVINEPYAVLSEGKTVLTFYYDHLKKDRGGLSVGPFSSSGSSWVGTSGNNVTTATFDPSFANCTSITSTAYWFYHLYKLTAINGIEYLNTTNVTDMENMFGGCNSLTSLDVSKLNTCNVTNMTYMFASCNSLTSLDVSKFDTRNVTNMAYMFSGCASLTSLDVSHFDTKNVTSMQSMFNYCQSLTSINVDNFDTGKVTNFEFMFRQCNSLSDIYCDKSWVKDYIDSWAMFTACTNLRGYDYSHDYYANYFAKPYADGGYFTSTSRIGVDDSESETYAVLSDENTTLTFYFDNQKQTRAGMSVDGLSSPESRGWHNVASSITTAVFDLSLAYCQTLTSTSYWFKGCTNLTNIKDIKFLMTDNVTTMNDMFNGCSSLKDLDVTNFKTDNVTDMSGMFSGCSSLIRLDVSHFKTDNVTTMNGMFNGCSSLLSLDVTNFKPDNVTDMSSMFGNCSELRELDLGKFKTDNVTALNSMFEGCSHLMTIYVGSEWGSSSAVPTGNDMFKDCIVLVGGNETTYDANHIDYTYAHIDGGTANPGYFTDETSIRPEAYAVLSDENTKLTFYYDTMKSDRNGKSVGPFSYSSYRDWNGNSSNITTVVFDNSFANYMTLTSTAYWFYGCSKLTTFENINNLRTDNVTNMKYMFYGCSSLTDLNLSSFTTGYVTDMSSMFENCSSLTTLVLGSSFNTAKVTDMNYMFEDCKKLTSLDVSNFNTANVGNMSYMFTNCSSLTSLDVSSFNTSNVGNMSYMFNSCSSLTSLDLSSFNTDKVTKMDNMFQGCSSLTSLNVNSFNTAKITNMSRLFCDCYSLTTLDLSSFNTANVTNMELMFADCRALLSLDLSSFDTNKVTNMADMFENCTSLASIDLSSFNTDNVTKMEFMFDDCSSLTSIDVSNFNTSNVTSMYDMFQNCSSLTKLDVTNFKTDNVTRMDGIFRWCSGLTTIDLSNFKTDNVTNMGEMFYGCSGLTSIDLSNFKTNNVTRMDGMFRDCPNLRSIYVSDDWNTDAVTYSVSMFSNSSSLVGGAGTTYDGNYTDVGYAHIDGGSSNPGYLNRDTDREPYAVLSDNDDEVTVDGIIVNGKTLTFYYDNNRGEDGMDIGPFNYFDTRGWNDADSTITSVVFDASFTSCNSLKSTAYWFHGCKNLTTITGIENLKTDNVTDMNRMFCYCSKLTSLDVSGLNTANVTTMYGMFSGCSSLTSLDLSGFNTSKVTNMGYMFNECSSLTTLDISGFNTDNVTDMVSMFYGCFSLTSLDVSGFKTDRVTNMSDMFTGCSSLGSLDVSGFNTENVTNMYGMFYDCSGLTSLDVSGFKTDNVTYMGWMFTSCSSLASLDVSGFKTDNVTDMNFMFYGCSGLTSLDVSGFNTENVTGMDCMFYGCSSLTNLDVSGFKTDRVTNMSNMFVNCSSLANLDVSGFNTDNVTDMGFMFSGCSSLTSLDVSGFKTENVTKMKCMFYNCSSLTSLDVSGFNTEKVTEMDGMFYRCSSLASLDVSGFNTSNVTDMGWMFYGCSSLTSLDLSGFNTSNVTDMGRMFDGCSSLTSLDLSSFNISKVEYDADNDCYGIEYMFSGCSALTTIYVGDGWTTENLTEGVNVFNNCTILVGDAGTTYDAEHTDYTYAHIDGGTSNPGYFTDKNKKNVTITAKSCSREYGEANPTFEYTVEGATLSGEPTITCEATATSPVGTYPIVVTYTAEDAAKMNLTYVDGALTITKAPLTITAKSYTIIQGEPIPTFEVEYTGFKNNDTDTVFTTKPTISTEAKSDTIPGNYDIVVSGAVAANYEMKYVNGTLTITDDVTVTAKSYSRVYGDANPTFEFTSEGATLSGTPTISCEATATSPVGTYAIVISKGSISNSTVTYVSGTLTITKAPLTITAKSCTIKQGKTLPEFELEYSGLKNKETDTVFTKKPTVSTVATSNSEPGTYDITVSGAEAKNYEMKYVKGTLTITERTETFDGIVLTVNEGGNMDDAFEIYGGKEEAAKTIAAIIWNASEKLTDKMLEGINNPNLLVYVSETSMAPESTKNVVIDGKAKSIELVDAEGNNNFFVPQEFTTENISYSRAFKQTTQDGISRGWEGIALPFNVQKFIHEEHGEISPFGDSNCDYHFWLRQPTDDGVINALSIEANKPYIISMPNSDEYDPEFNHPGLLRFISSNVTIPATKVDSVWLGDSAQIAPTFLNIEAAPDIYVLNVGDSIMNHREGSIFISNYRSARPFEVYTIHEPRANETNTFGSRIISLSSLFGGNGTTGIIDAMKTTEPNGERWYDMNGRRLQGKAARKGIYILNGKKVVIK